METGRSNPPLSMLVQFTKNGSNTIIGNFQSGDRARVSDALAKHLADFGVAKIIETQPEKKKTLKLKK